MDTLYKLFLKKRFVDLELILDDGSNKLTLNVHKILLIEHSPYFEKLLTFNGDPLTLTLNIPNVYVAFDVILSFYGVNLNSGNLAKRAHALAIAKCRDYFGLEALKYDIGEKIEEVDYDIILELCSIVGFDEANLRILSDNLPLDYPLAKLSKDFINEIIKIKTSYGAISHNDNKITWWDIRTGKIVYLFEPFNEEVSNRISDYLVSDDNQYLYITPIEENDYLLDIKNSLLKYTFGSCTEFKFSADSKYLARAQNGCLILLDLTSGKIIAQKYINEVVTVIKFVPCSMNKRLGISTFLSCILWDTDTNSIRVLNSDECTNLSFTSCGKYIEASFVSHDIPLEPDDYMKIWDISKDSPVELYQKSKIIGISFKNNSDYVIIREGDGIKIYDLDNNLIQSFEDKFTRFDFSKNNDYIVIYYNPYGGDYAGTKIRNVITGRKFFKLESEFDASSRSSFKFSPCGKFLAENDWISIKIWDMATTKMLFNIGIDGLRSKIIKFTPDDRYIMVRSKNDLQLYDMLYGKLIAQINAKNIDFWNLKVYHDEECKKLIEEMSINPS